MSEKLPPIYVKLPSQRPMTDAEIIEASRNAVQKHRGARKNIYLIVARAIEMHHGITGAPAKEPIKFSD